MDFPLHRIENKTHMPNIVIENQQLYYRDEGQGPVLVIVHGTPSSSAEFAEVITQLKSRYRCIAIDHLGFGQSAKPPDGDYTLQAHTRRLKFLLDSLKIQKFHLLFHDFGGVISLPIAIERWDQIESLNIMNSWAWPMIETAPELKGQKSILGSGLMKWLYLHFNFSAKILVKAGWGKHRPLTKEKHRVYTSAFRSSSERWGTVGFLKALIDFENPAWKLSHQLKALPEKKVRLIWGEADAMIKTKNLDRWKELFPNAEVHLLTKVGHFVADEAPELVIKYL